MTVFCRAVKTTWACSVLKISCTVDRLGGSSAPEKAQLPAPLGTCCCHLCVCGHARAHSISCIACLNVCLHACSACMFIAGRNVWHACMHARMPMSIGHADDCDYPWHSQNSSISQLGCLLLILWIDSMVNTIWLAHAGACFHARVPLVRTSAQVPVAACADAKAFC